MDTRELAGAARGEVVDPGGIKSSAVGGEVDLAGDNSAPPSPRAGRCSLNLAPLPGRGSSRMRLAVEAARVAMREEGGSLRLGE